MPRLEPSAIADAIGEPQGPDPSADRDGRLVAILAEILGAEPSSLAAGLVDAGLLDLDALADAGPNEWLEALGPAKDAVRKRIPAARRFARWLRDRGGIEGLDEVSTPTLRDQLAEIPGLGPASVESALLFGLGRPAYPVDRATFRVLVRHGWIDESTSVDEVRDLLIDSADADPRLLARLSRGIDRIGRSACRAGAPRCDRCPLAHWLPEDGPIGSGD